jgi:hypothetical protein
LFSRLREDNDIRFFACEPFVAGVVGANLRILTDRIRTDKLCDAVS